MKKIIALFVIMLAFSFNANAQKKNNTTATATQQTKVDEAQVQKLGEKDLQRLHELVNLTANQKTALIDLFKYKHRTHMENPNFSQERKSILAENIETKIKSAITPEQIAKLEDNPEILTILVNK